MLRLEFAVERICCALIGQPSWVVCILDVAKSRSEKQWPLFFKFVEKIVDVALARTYASTYGTMNSMECS